jgi:chaperone required for assembly of F1-ATPase
MKLLRSFSLLPDLLSGNNIQKFYKSSGAKETLKGFQVTLDSRALFTSKKQPLVVPTQLLALSIAQEYNSQDKFLQKKRMPLVIPI